MNIHPSVIWQHVDLSGEYQVSPLDAQRLKICHIAGDSHTRIGFENELIIVAAEVDSSVDENPTGSSDGPVAVVEVRTDPQLVIAPSEQDTASDSRLRKEVHYLLTTITADGKKGGRSRISSS